MLDVSTVRVFFVLAALALGFQAGTAASQDTTCVHNGITIIATNSATFDAAAPTDSGRKTCSLRADKVSIKFAFYSAAPNTDLDLIAIRAAYYKSSGASIFPEVRVSLSNALSDLEFIFRGTISFQIYSAPDHMSGYVAAVVSQDKAVFGIWSARTATTAEEVASSFLANDGGANWLSKAALLLGLAIGAMIPLVYLFHIRFRHATDEVAFKAIEYGVRTAQVALVLLIAPIASIVVFGFSTQFVVVLWLYICAVSLFAYFDLGRQGVLRTKVSQILSKIDRRMATRNLSKSGISISGADVSSRYDLNVTGFIPNKMHCVDCDLDYIVHSIGRASEEIPEEYFKESERHKDEIDRRAKKLHELAFSRALPALCSCPRCGSAKHLSHEQIQGLKQFHWREARKGVVWGGVAIVALVAVWLSEVFSESLNMSEWPIVGGVLSQVYKVSFGSLGGLADELLWGAIAAVAVSVILIIRRPAISLKGTWVCPVDGYIFEDHRQQLERGPRCPGSGAYSVPGTFCRFVASS